MLERIYKKAYIAGNPNLAEYIRTSIAVENHKVIDTAATDGYSIFYNPAFLKDLSDDQILGVFSHEYYHIIYDHINRRNWRDTILWNISCDIIVNEAVKQRMKLKLPECCLARGKGIFKELPVEADTSTKIYDWILTNANKLSASEIEHGEAHVNKQEAAQNESTGQRGELDKKKTDAQAREANKASAELREAMGLNTDDCDWIDLVQALKIESGRLVHRTHKRSYMRPARYEPQGLIRPNNARWQHHPKIDVYIDISGSMRDNPRYIFQGLKTILSSLRIYRPRFFSFNTEIKNVDIKDHILKIGGGTDIKKVLKKIHNDNADLAILITDCEDSLTKSDFKNNVVVVSNNTSFADYYTKNWKKVKRRNQNAK